MSVWHLVSLLFLFRVRCCSPPACLSPGARRAQTLFPILLGTHTLTHSHVTHRRTSSRAPAPPRSLIYSYLMLRCHNSLSGSLAWQPFVRRCSRGGKRNPAASFWSFSPTVGMEYACWECAGGNKHIISSYRLALCCEAVDGVRGIKLMWQPLPARTGLWRIPLRSQDAKWHLEMRIRRWKGVQGLLDLVWHFQTPMGDRRRSIWCGFVHLV